MGTPLSAGEWQLDVQRIRKAKDKEKHQDSMLVCSEFPPIRVISISEFNSYQDPKATPIEIVRIEVLGDDSFADHSHLNGSKTLSIQPAHTLSEIENLLFEKLASGIPYEKREVCFLLFILFYFFILFIFIFIFIYV